MIDARILPVLTVESVEDAERRCRALLADGYATVEITLRTGAAVDAIRRVASIDGLTVGAGTVLEVSQLDAAVNAGARFAVSPSTSPELIHAARRSGLTFIPGAATPTEIDRARSLGCDVVKVFPASVLGGPAFIRAVSAVFPDVRFIPTGGINAANVDEYLTLPSVLACGGSWLA